MAPCAQESSRPEPVGLKKHRTREVSDSRSIGCESVAAVRFLTVFLSRSRAMVRQIRQKPSSLMRPLLAVDVHADKFLWRCTSRLDVRRVDVSMLLQLRHQRRQPRRVGALQQVPAPAIGVGGAGKHAQQFRARIGAGQYGAHGIGASSGMQGDNGVHAA